MKNSERFLNAFVNIEKILKDRFEMKHYSFTKMVHMAAGRDSMVRYVRDDLLEYAQLRNAIVHNRVNLNEAIAEPHDDVVKHIEAIETFLSRPNTLENVEFADVFTAEMHDDLQEIAYIQEKHNYSVVPVYNGKVYQGALHARLYQRAFALGSKQVETIEDMFAYDNYQNRLFFISEKMKIWDVLSLYQRQYEKGEAIIAFFVTENGSAKEKIKGVLTHADIPCLMKHLNIPY